MKIKQTKSVTVDWCFHEERISITQMPKDLMIQALDALIDEGSFNYDNDYLCYIRDMVEGLSEFEEIIIPV